MASAWITKRFEEDGKRRQKKVEPGMAGVKTNDRFSVEWLDPKGNRQREAIKGTGKVAKRMADDRWEQLNSQFSQGNYKPKNKHTWQAFREQFDQKVISNAKPGTARCMRESMDHFETILRPDKMDAIDSEAMAGFKSKLLQRPGKKRGSKISKATVNKVLRHIKAIFATAEEWGYMDRVPKIRMEKLRQKVVTFVTPEHFAEIYKACKSARRPADMAVDWWRALLIFCYMTAWRISEPLSLTRDDLDLENGTAITRENKGCQDELVPIHPIVVEHLRRIQGFGELVFDWPHDRRTLDVEFHDIQRAAGIHLTCPAAKEHECTEACHVYGFHDLRRSFATRNALRMSPDDLQKMMRHKSYLTTKLYIAMGDGRLNKAVAQLDVPELPNVKVS